jgi:ABC-type polysaccharide/polyol phosphate export permease
MWMDPLGWSAKRGMDGNPAGMEVRSTAKFPHTEFFPPAPAPRGPVRWIACLREDHQDLVRFWPVVQNMVVQELRVRYQRSFLGFVWTLLNPILMMVILSWVFGHIMDRVPNYSLFLFAGMVPWSFLSICLNECAFSIINNEGLIRKIYLPKLVFPLVRVLIALVTFVLSLAALFVLLFPLGARPSFALLFLPVAIALLGMFALGLGLIVATLNTFYRDCGHLIAVVLQAWYFATPILFPIDQFKDAQWRLRLNPAC